MSAPTKLRGGSDSELTKLKALWRGLAEDARAFWREQFGSLSKQADVRQLLRARLKINLAYDKQLTQFRQWVEAQDQREAVAERMEENRERIQRLHPDWTLDQVRDEVIKSAYEETLASGNFKLGLATVKQDLNVKKIALDSRKLAILEKKASAFDQAKEVVESTLTPEEQKRRLKEILK